MRLFFREFGEGKPIIILHGVFGSSDNWLSVSKKLSESYKVYAIDQRNHGQSFHSDEFNYDVMANDLKKFLEEHQINNPVLIGHSMGGKVAMTFAVQHPDLFEKLVVADITPGELPVRHDTILEGLCAIDIQNIKSRQEADDQLAPYVPQKGVRQFLLKSLSRNDNGGFEWKINLPVIEKNIDKIGEGIDATKPVKKPTLFLRGEKSDYITAKDEALIKKIFPNSQLKTIENAGHWLHAEQPEIFLKYTTEFIDS